MKPVYETVVHGPYYNDDRTRAIDTILFDDRLRCRTTERPLRIRGIGWVWSGVDTFPVPALLDELETE